MRSTANKKVLPWWDVAGRLRTMSPPQSFRPSSPAFRLPPASLPPPTKRLRRGEGGGGEAGNVIPKATNVVKGYRTQVTNIKPLAMHHCTTSASSHDWLFLLLFSSMRFCIRDTLSQRRCTEWGESDLQGRARGSGVPYYGAGNHCYVNNKTSHWSYVTRF